MDVLLFYDYQRLSYNEFAYLCAFCFIAVAMRNVLIVVGLTLLYIYLLTVLFENFVNKASNTLLTLSGIVLFLLISYCYATFIIKTFKNRLK